MRSARRSGAIPLPVREDGRRPGEGTLAISVLEASPPATGCNGPSPPLRGPTPTGRGSGVRGRRLVEQLDHVLDADVAAALAQAGAQLEQTAGVRGRDHLSAGRQRVLHLARLQLARL